MAPKKSKKVALSEFLADDATGGSWADEMDSLPTAPAPRDASFDAFGLGGSHLSRGSDRYGSSGGPGGDRGGFGLRGDAGGFDRDRPPRVELPVPDQPPYNAFIGNLSFEVTSSDLELFFGDKVTSVRMITEPSGKPKGYGYVEFSEREALVAALDRSGRDFQGRTIRISVAEPPSKDRDSQRTEGAWRREGPLPPLDDRRHPSGGGFSSRDSAPDFDRGERMGFGSKFVPSADADGARGFRRPPGSGDRAASGFGFGARDGPEEDRGERMGFGSKFVPSGPERSDREPPRRGSGFAPSGDRPGFGDRRSSDALPGMADSASSWRSSRPSGNGSASPADSPVQRRKLELAARSVSSSTIAEESAPSPSANKPSPFGNARPIDSAERERAIEARISKDKDERAAKAEAEKADREKNRQATDDARKSTRANAPNPFGAAKPVDTLTRELEVEDKLAKERKERVERTQKPSPAGGSGAAWGPTRRTSTATSSAGSKATPSPGPASPKANGSSAHLAASPTAGSEEGLKSPPLSTSSLRKEGVSFAALARGGSGPATSPNEVDEAEKKVEGLALSSD